VLRSICSTGLYSCLVSNTASLVHDTETPGGTFGCQGATLGNLVGLGVSSSGRVSPSGPSMMDECIDRKDSKLFNITSCRQAVKKYYTKSLGPNAPDVVPTGSTVLCFISVRMSISIISLLDDWLLLRGLLQLDLIQVEMPVVDDHPYIRLQ
jgi:hypothetical protein